jgi:hypothetical protein
VARHLIILLKTIAFYSRRTEPFAHRSAQIFLLIILNETIDFLQQGNKRVYGLTGKSEKTLAVDKNLHID